MSKTKYPIVKFDVEYVSNPEGRTEAKRYVGVATYENGAKYNHVMLYRQYRRFIKSNTESKEVGR